MGKGKPIIIVLAIIAIILVAVVGTGRMKLPMMTGYGGPVTSIIDVEHTYPVNFNLLEVVNLGTTAYVETGTNDLLDAVSPAGVRCAIDSVPGEINRELIDTISRSDIDKDAETNTTKTWEVWEVVFEMGITLSTYKGGLQGIYTTTFWIDAKENAFDVFTGADEVESYIIFGETPKLAHIVGSFQCEPQAKGDALDLQTVESATVPAWIIDSGYTSNFQYFEHVKFPVTALSGAPTTIAGLARTESSATLTINLHLIVFGMWERVAPYTEWDWPEPPDLLGDLLAFLLQTAWILGGFIIMIAVLYLAPSKWKVIGPVIFVVFLMIGMGFFDSFLGASGV